MEITAPPPPGPAPDPVREMWATAAAGWEEHAGYVDERGAAVTEAICAARRRPPASASSSWPAARAGSASPRPSVSAPPATWSCPTSSRR